MYAQLRVGWTVQPGYVSGVITVCGCTQVLFTLRAASIAEALEALPPTLRQVFSKPTKCDDDEVRASRTPRPVDMDQLFDERRFTDLYPELLALRDAEKLVLHRPVELIADCGQLCAKVDMWVIPVKLAFLLMVTVPNARFENATRRVVDLTDMEFEDLPLLDVEEL